jgi:hypothetical protein
MEMVYWARVVAGLTIAVFLTGFFLLRGNAKVRDAGAMEQHFQKNLPAGWRVESWEHKQDAKTHEVRLNYRIANGEFFGVNVRSTAGDDGAEVSFYSTIPEETQPGTPAVAKRKYHAFTARTGEMQLYPYRCEPSFKDLEETFKKLSNEIAEVFMEAFYD